MGFNLLIEFVASYKGNTDEFCDDFIDEIEASNLYYGAWLEEACISGQKGVELTDQHKEKLRTWLLSRPEVKSVQIGPFHDAWYPDSE